MPTLTVLNECFELGPDGVLTWKKRPLHHFDGDVQWRRWNTRYAGKLAGFSAKRYRKVAVFDEPYPISRIIFCMTTGRDPGVDLIDHRDLDGFNNAPGNLRATDKSGNAQNTGVRSNNKSGIKGVSWSKTKKRWRARVIRKGQRVEALFDALEEAAKFVRAARDGLYGDLSRHI